MSTNSPVFLHFLAKNILVTGPSSISKVRWVHTRSYFLRMAVMDSCGAASSWRRWKVAI